MLLFLLRFPFDASSYYCFALDCLCPLLLLFFFLCIIIVVLPMFYDLFLGCFLFIIFSPLSFVSPVLGCPVMTNKGWWLAGKGCSLLVGGPWFENNVFLWFCYDFTMSLLWVSSSRSMASWHLCHPDALGRDGLGDGWHWGWDAREGPWMTQLWHSGELGGTAWCWFST